MRLLTTLLIEESKKPVPDMPNKAFKKFASRFVPLSLLHTMRLPDPHWTAGDINQRFTAW